MLKKKVMKIIKDEDTKKVCLDRESNIETQAIRQYECCYLTDLRKIVLINP